MDKIVIRPANDSDIPSLCTIHNEGIEDKIATLDEVPHSLSYQKEWFRKHKFPYGVWVAKKGPLTIGWVSLNSFNLRPAYKFVADLSVYVMRTERGRGIGTTLINFVLEKARKNGFHKVVISAFPFNKQGLRLYKKFGFSKVGIYKEQGKLNNKWMDVIILEKILALNS